MDTSVLRVLRFNEIAFVVVDGIKFKVSSRNYAKETVIIQHPWTLKDDEWHISEVERLLDLDGEIIEFE